MTVLAQLLVRRNLFLLALVLGIGLGVYLFVEVFDRLDNFLEAGVPLRFLGLYVLYRSPFILAQIFPGAVVVAVGVQMALMGRARELIALRAAAVSPWSWERVFLVYAMCFPKELAWWGMVWRNAFGTRRCGGAISSSVLLRTSGFGKTSPWCGCNGFSRSPAGAKVCGST
jgi:hypothetical protein